MSEFAWFVVVCMFNESAQGDETVQSQKWRRRRILVGMRRGDSSATVYGFLGIVRVCAE